MSDTTTALPNGTVFGLFSSGKYSKAILYLQAYLEKSLQTPMNPGMPVIPKTGIYDDRTAFFIYGLLYTKGRLPKDKSCLTGENTALLPLHHYIYGGGGSYGPLGVTAINAEIWRDLELEPWLLAADGDPVWRNVKLPAVDKAAAASASVMVPLRVTDAPSPGVVVNGKTVPESKIRRIKGEMYIDVHYLVEKVYMIENIKKSHEYYYVVSTAGQKEYHLSLCVESDMIQCEIDEYDTNGEYLDDYGYEIAHYGIYVKWNDFDDLMWRIGAVKGIAENVLLALAKKYGDMSYKTKAELLNTEHVNLLARVIYGEQTQKADYAQHAIAWLMANRVLAQRKGEFSYGDKPSSLATIATRQDAFTCLDRIGGLSYASKKNSDEGWINAVMLAWELVDIFSTYYVEEVPLKTDEKDAIRMKLAARIDESPIGKGCWYVAKKQFDAFHTEEKGKHFYKGHEIYPDFKDFRGNTFYNYSYAEL